MGNVRLLINCDRHAMGLADTEAEQLYYEATAASGANCCPKDRHEHAHRLGGVSHACPWSSANEELLPPG